MFFSFNTWIYCATSFWSAVSVEKSTDGLGIPSNITNAFLLLLLRSFPCLTLILNYNVSWWCSLGFIFLEFSGLPWSGFLFPPPGVASFHPFFFFKLIFCPPYLSPFFYFFLSFFPWTSGMHKFWGQVSNLYHSSENVRSLTARPPEDSLSLLFLIPL